MQVEAIAGQCAKDSNLKQPVAGWDRWKLSPRTDNRHYTLVCHHNGVHREL